MTTIETIIHLATAVLPSLGVLAFLLLHRRQSIQADLESVRLRQQQCQHADAERSSRFNALSQVATALGPTLHELVEQLVLQPRSTAGLSAVSDDELVAELDRRVDEHGWKHGNPFAPLDHLLERLWANGVEVTSPLVTPPPSSSPRAEPS